MSGKKGLFLFLALLLPICIFIFLKFFGKNEFAVAPLYQEEDKQLSVEGCGPIQFPYSVKDAVRSAIMTNKDSLAIVYFKNEDATQESSDQINRIANAFKEYPVKLNTLSGTSQDTRCAFLLPAAYDVVLIDKNGFIRGQYASDDLDEMDRLIMEVDIILKKY